MLEYVKNYLESLRGPAEEEAKYLFQDHPKAQDVWVKLNCHDGGIEPVVEQLGLQRDYKEYLKTVNESIEKGMYDIAEMQIEGFVHFCKQQVIENFYMFK